MSLLRIIVPIAGSSRDHDALRTAFAAARPFNAHVSAVFVHRDARLSLPYFGVPVSPQIVQTIVEATERLIAAASKSARAVFATAAEEAHVRILAGPEHAGTVTASFIDMTGTFLSCLEEAAFLADLIVFPPPAQGETAEMHEAFIRVLTKSGCPVLLSPQNPPGEIGRNIAIGWDGGAAAAHAMSAAIPYLRRADSVQLFSVGRARADAPRIAEAKAYLKLHGVPCSAVMVEAAERPVGDMLMDAATANGCDLLVLGGFGHSRLSEAVFGGVTQRVVSHPKLPAFMIH